MTSLATLLWLLQALHHSPSWGAAQLPECSGHTSSNEIRDKLTAANRIAEDGRLAAYFFAAWRVFGQLQKECTTSVNHSQNIRLVTTTLFLKLHRYSELTTLTDDIIESAKNEPDQMFGRRLHRQALVVKMRAAAGERDPIKLAAAISHFDSLPADGSPADAIMENQAAYFRGCRLEARLSCQNDGIPVFFGQYFLSSDQSHLVPQCDSLPAFQPEAYAKGQAFEVVAAPASALNGACETEASMAGLVLAWWDAVYGRDGHDRAIQIGRSLVAQLTVLAQQIDKFDRDNAVSRFQVRALAYFVERKILSIEKNLSKEWTDRISYTQEQMERIARFRSEIEPPFDAAIKSILAGHGGFLRVDTLGLAAFVAAGLGRTEDMWAIAMASHGPQTMGYSPSLSDFRSHLRAGQVAVVPVHSIDTDGAIMTFGREGPITLEEMYINSRRARFAGDALMNSMMGAPTVNSVFPIKVAQSLYYHYVCPAERARGPNKISKIGSIDLIADQPLNAKEIVFVADPFLNQIPLTLITKSADGCLASSLEYSGMIHFRDLARVKWISDDFSISVVTFGPGRAKGARPIGGPRFLGVGGTASSANINRNPNPPIQDRQMRERLHVWTLDDLPNSTNEVNESAAFFADEQKTVLLGPNATEAEVRKGLSLHPKIVLFATHAVAPQTEDAVTEPILKLSIPKKLSDIREEDDGLLKAAEISKFELGGAVVILSACQSSAPGIGIANGLFSGLVASFLNAGASDTIATYWRIADAQTANFVPQLVRALADGVNVPSAVQQTQMLWRESHSSGMRTIGLGQVTQSRTTNANLLLHPYYWGGFITVSSYEAWASRMPQQ